MINDLSHKAYTFNKDKNISFAIYTLINGHYNNLMFLPENEGMQYKMLLEGLKAVHNLNQKQAETVIKLAKDYINNNQ